MIDSTSHISAQQVFGKNLMEHAKAKTAAMPNSVEFPNGLDQLTKTNKTESFDNVVGKLVSEVDGKIKDSARESNKVLLGETDNIHQSMIASQESGLAFTMMVEVRNKLVHAYQELIKMPV